MKKIVFVVLTSLILGNAVGQEVDFTTKHQLGLRIGQSMPLGIYEDKAIGHHADNGLVIGVFYQYDLTQGLAGTIEYMSFSNPINTDTYDKSIEAQIGSDVFVSTDADAYKVEMIAVGVKLSFGNGPVTGYINPALGSAKFISPEFDTDIIDPGGTYNYVYSETDESKTVLLLNVGADYKISKLINLGVNIGYINMGSFEMKTDMKFSYNGIQNQNNETEFYQSYSSLNTTISLGFNF